MTQVLPSDVQTAEMGLHAEAPVAHLIVDGGLDSDVEGFVDVLALQFVGIPQNPEVMPAVEQE